MTTRKQKLATRIRDIQKRKFLRYFQRLRTVGAAAEKIHVDRMTVHRWLQKDAKFRAAYDDTCEAMVDAVEAELMALTDGTYKRLVVSGGKVLGEEPIHDVKAMEVFLRAHRHHYRPEPLVAITNAVGVQNKLVLKPKAQAAMVAQATQFYLEAINGPASPEDAQPATVEDTLADMKFRHKTLPVFTQEPEP
jgi:hypothetical protein